MILKTKIVGWECMFENKGGVFSYREIDPGTRLLAETYDGEGDKILDLGCGYGAIGIAIAKKFPDKTIWMGDDSLRAVEMARKNAKLNGVKVNVVLSDGFSKIDERFDAILSNLPLGYGNDLVEELIRESYQHLSRIGSVWVVTQNRFKDLIGRLFAGVGLKPERIARGREHVVVKGMRE